MDTDCIPEGSVVIFAVVSGAAIVTLGAASGPGGAHLPMADVYNAIRSGNLINPRRACARVTVLFLSVSVCVCVFPILAPRAIRRTNSSVSDFSAIRA